MEDINKGYEQFIKNKPGKEEISPQLIGLYV